MPKMKNATTRRIARLFPESIPAVTWLFAAPLPWAFGAVCTTGSIATALTAAAAGAAIGAATCAIGWSLASIGRAHEADRPDPETWSWASPQGLPTAGPGEPVRRRDGHPRFDNTGPA